MEKLSIFQSKRINKLNLIKGGGETGGGTKRTNTTAGNFYYESDFSTKKPGDTSWTISYYGVKTCGCP